MSTHSTNKNQGISEKQIHIGECVLGSGNSKAKSVITCLLSKKSELVSVSVCRIRTSKAYKEL
jgi:hypothetical protein